MTNKFFLELLLPIKKIIFRSNHASNALDLSGVLPKDKNRLINELKVALEIGQGAFIPNKFRDAYIGLTGHHLRGYFLYQYSI